MEHEVPGEQKVPGGIIRKGRVPMPTPPDASPKSYHSFEHDLTLVTTIVSQRGTSRG